MEGLAQGHAAEPHPAKGHCLCSGASTVLEFGRPGREVRWAAHGIWMAPLGLSFPICTSSDFSGLYFWVRGLGQSQDRHRKEERKRDSYRTRYRWCPPGRSHLWPLPEGFLWLQEYEAQARDPCQQRGRQWCGNMASSPLKPVLLLLPEFPGR